MSDATMPDAASTPGTQIFKLVDSRVQPSAAGGCGCGGTGGCGGKKRSVDPGDIDTRGEHQRGHQRQHGHGGGGCGCGGHGRGARHGVEVTSVGSEQSAAQAEDIEEFRVHDLPRVVRKQLLLHAMDVLPVDASIIVVTAHQPDSLFAHLQQSESHYRVQTRESGPERWSYLITRAS